MHTHMRAERGGRGLTLVAPVVLVMSVALVVSVVLVAPTVSAV